MQRARPLALTLFLLAGFFPAAARGDVLELKGGKVLQGTYQGGTAGTVRFETADGLLVVERANILALTITGGAPAAAAAPAAVVPAAAPAAPAQAAAGGPVTIPAGTVLLVRTVDAVSSKDHAGKRFAARLDADLAAQGVSVVKAGTTVYGTVGETKQAGRVAGKSEVHLSLTELVIDGKPIPLVTGEFGLKTASGSGKKTLGGAAVGAGLGAALGGDKNAAGKGAAIGVAASLLKPGQTVQIPPDTLLEFELSQPVTLPATP